MERKTILAISSSGGHWQQLCLLSEAFGHHRVIRVSTTKNEVEDHYQVPNCSLTSLWLLPVVAAKMLILLFRFRPHFVVSTGAMPGLIGVALGRLLGAKTVWIDSYANAEKMSLSGRAAKSFANLWLTQSPRVARETGAKYAGALL